MSSPRERMLAEGIKNKLIAIQESKQIFEKLAKWKREVLLMDRKEKAETANSKATKVEEYVRRIKEETGNQPTAQQIMKKIKEELERIWL